MFFHIYFHLIVVTWKGFLCHVGSRGAYQYKDTVLPVWEFSNISYLYNGNTHTWKDGLYIEKGQNLIQDPVSWNDDILSVWEIPLWTVIRLSYYHSGIS